LRTVAAILGGVLGAVLGFYAGAYGRVAYMHLTSRDYDPGMDYSAVVTTGSMQRRLPFGRSPGWSLDTRAAEDSGRQWGSGWRAPLMMEPGAGAPQGGRLLLLALRRDFQQPLQLDELDRLREVQVEARFARTALIFFLTVA
jgi:hypothetical protein